MLQQIKTALKQTFAFRTTSLLCSSVHHSGADAESNQTHHLSTTYRHNQVLLLVNHHLLVSSKAGDAFRVSCLNHFLQTLQHQVELIDSLANCANRRERIELANQKTELLLDMAAALKFAVQYFDAGKAFLQKALEVYKYVEGDLGSHTIETACLLADRFKSYNEVQAIYKKLNRSSRLRRKVAIKCFEHDQTEDIYQFILENRQAIVEAELEYQFHKSAIEQAIRENYQHQLEWHLLSTLEIIQSQKKAFELLDYSQHLSDRSQRKQKIILSLNTILF